MQRGNPDSQRSDHHRGRPPRRRHRTIAEKVQSRRPALSVQRRPPTLISSAVDRELRSSRSHASSRRSSHSKRRTPSSRARPHSSRPRRSASHRGLSSRARVLAAVVFLVLFTALHGDRVREVVARREVAASWNRDWSSTSLTQVLAEDNFAEGDRAKVKGLVDSIAVNPEAAAAFAPVMKKVSRNQMPSGNELLRLFKSIPDPMAALQLLQSHKDRDKILKDLRNHPDKERLKKELDSHPQRERILKSLKQ